ncbi:MAG: hypothetical protein ACYC27_12250 [Armatimonadota bacterium]
MDGKEVKVQEYHIQLCYSKRKFMMMLPFQEQEALLSAHVKVFNFIGSIPRNVS